MRAIDVGLTKRLTDIADVVNITHGLVNSRMAALLQAHADLWRRLADSNVGTPQDKKSAALAEQAAATHTEDQKMVNDARDRAMQAGPDLAPQSEKKYPHTAGATREPA